MPMFRALLAAPLVLALLAVGSASMSSEPHLTTASSYLPRFVVEGRAPAAAFPARRDAPRRRGGARLRGALNKAICRAPCTAGEPTDPPSPCAHC
ncbi:hypothetical protein ACWD04_26305 [Streptomyces sp. NPDC002911]